MIRQNPQSGPRQTSEPVPQSSVNPQIRNSSTISHEVVSFHSPHSQNIPNQMLFQTSISPQGQVQQLVGSPQIKHGGNSGNAVAFSISESQGGRSPQGISPQSTVHYTNRELLLMQENQSLSTKSKIQTPSQMSCYVCMHFYKQEKF